MAHADLIMISQTSMPSFSGWTAYNLIYPDGSESSPEHSVIQFGTLDIEASGRDIRSMLAILNLAAYCTASTAAQEISPEQHIAEIFETILTILNVDFKMVPNLHSHLLILEPTIRFRASVIFPFHRSDLEEGE
jgi:hypothetical protein